MLGIHCANGVFCHGKRIEIIKDVAGAGHGTAHAREQLIADRVFFDDLLVENHRGNCDGQNNKKENQRHGKARGRNCRPPVHPDALIVGANDRARLRGAGLR